MISRLPCLSKCLFVQVAVILDNTLYENICWFICLLIKLQVFIQLLCILCVWNALVSVVTFFTFKLKCWFLFFFLNMWQKIKTQPRLVPPTAVCPSFSNTLCSCWLPLSAERHSFQLEQPTCRKVTRCNFRLFPFRVLLGQFMCLLILAPVVSCYRNHKKTALRVNRCRFLA